MMAFVNVAPISRPTTRGSPQNRLAVCSQVESASSDNANLSEGEAEVVKTPVACESCGLEGGPSSGCDGNGRIIGGLGAVVKWWPIKAYRPCPEFLKTKKTYKRAGQSLDEIAFGRKGEGDDKSLNDRLSGR